MSETTIRRIGSGCEIVASSRNGFTPWEKVHVLGTERCGIVPIRICESSVRVCEPSIGTAPIRLSTLENTFPNGRAKITYRHFEGLEHDIQRLWDYDELWDKDSEYPRLRLDPTWVILDENENIAMLRKEYPEEIPYDYKIAKIKPINEHEFNVDNIEISSLKWAIESLNWILSRTRISSTIFIDGTKQKKEENTTTSSKAVILVEDPSRNLNGDNAPQIRATVLGKKIGRFIPILTENGFSITKTNEDTMPFPRDFLTSEVKNVISEERIRDPARTAHNIRTIWDYEGLLDHNAQVPMLKPYAIAWVTFYNNGRIREIKDMPTVHDMKEWPYAVLRANDPFNLVISSEKNAPKSFQNDIDVLNFLFATLPKNQIRSQPDSVTEEIITPNYAQERQQIFTELIVGAA